MPLSNPFANRRIVEAVKAIREHPDAAYGIAIGLVAFATLTRWVMAFNYPHFAPSLCRRDFANS